jgi:polar amino acid transport system substrate-binding protein
MTNTVPPDAAKELAPSGKLVAAINYGNTVLAQKDPVTGEPGGISADLARELARRLGVPVEFVTFDTAGKVSDAASAGVWNVAFLAIDPKRAEEITFTPPYVLIEGTYVVPEVSPLQTIEDVDSAGTRIAVGQKTAYDLFLTRAIKNAELVRAPSSAAALQMFLDDGIEAVAGVKQPLIAFAASQPGLRVIDERFMAIEQAMCIPKGRNAGARYLREFIEELKASGFVAQGLERSGQGDAQVAPAAK